MMMLLERKMVCETDGRRPTKLGVTIADRNIVVDHVN